MVKTLENIGTEYAHAWQSLHRNRQADYTVMYVYMNKAQLVLVNCNKGAGLYGLGAAFTLPPRSSRNPRHRAMNKSIVIDGPTIVGYFCLIFVSIIDAMLDFDDSGYSQFLLSYLS